jgi:hypothetical protein
MEKLQWFKFTPSDWIMGKIQRCPEITQARFMRLICLYWNKECVLSFEDAEIEVDLNHLEILIAKKIVTKENESIKISFLDEQFLTIAETSKKNSTAAKKRWGKSEVKIKDIEINSYAVVSENNAVVIPAHNIVMPKSNIAMRSHQSAMRNDAEKRREEEIRKEKKRKDNINNVVFSNECKESEQWIETTSMQNRVKPEAISFFLSNFESHLITMEEQKKTLKEFKEHFSHWLRKQDMSVFKTKVLGKSNQL